MTSSDAVVIVGASLAGLQAAETVGASGFTGRLTLIGDEPHQPYDRPPLSKQALTGVADTATTTLPHAADLDVDWRLGHAAVSLETAARDVVLDSGKRVHYTRLLIATGRRSRPWPMESEAALDGVFVLRTADGAARIRTRLEERPSRVLVIGGRFTGGEIASSCSTLGIPVTVADRGPAPMTKIFGTVIGQMMTEIHRDHGVDLRTGTGVAALLGDDTGQLSGARLTDGSRLDVDLAVVAIGSEPNSDWVGGSGIACDDGGVLCDSAQRALDTDGEPMPDVFVAGDVARHPNPLAGPGLWTSERWGAAIGQADVAARNIVHAICWASAGTVRAVSPDVQGDLADPVRPLQFPMRRRAKPNRDVTRPRPIANAAVPNETTDVNSDARRNDAFMMIGRLGSSWGSSAKVFPPLIAVACVLMISACA